MLPKPDDKLLTRYLLGEVSATEQTQVEELLWADNASYDRLCALKEELTDQYVRGAMSAQAQQVFARRYLNSADGYEDKLFARALDAVLLEKNEARHVAAQPEVTSQSWSIRWREKLSTYFQPFPMWQMAMSAAALLLLLGVVWLLSETRRLRQELDSADRQIARVQTEAEQAARKQAELAEQLRNAQQRNEQLDQLSRTTQQERDQARKELERLSARSSSSAGTSSVGTFLSLLLVPGAGRGGAQVDELQLTRQTQNVRLLLLNPDPSKRNYRAEIRTKQGDLIYSQNQLSSRRTKDGQALQITLPAQRLKEGLYEVSLFGVQPGQSPELINYYDFKINRKQ